MPVEVRSVTRGRNMAKYSKKIVLKIILAAAKEYNEKLNNRHFLIIYQEGAETKSVCVGFRGTHFLHLTGVKSRLSAQHFFENCLDGKLSEKEFEIDDNGKVQQKLEVLPYLSDLL